MIEDSSSDEEDEIKVERFGGFINLSASFTRTRVPPEMPGNENWINYILMIFVNSQGSLKDPGQKHTDYFTVLSKYHLKIVLLVLNGFGVVALI